MKLETEKILDMFIIHYKNCCYPIFQSIEMQD
jgi:hypothetical protein